jgi:hypothetical protein
MAGQLPALFFSGSGKAVMAVIYFQRRINSRDALGMTGLDFSFKIRI